MPALEKMEFDDKDIFYAGIEGGTTSSTIAVLDSQGNLVTTYTGPHTNPYMLGLEPCLERIHFLVEEVKKKAGMWPELPFQSLGLSLSGGESERMQKMVVAEMLERYPYDCLSCKMWTDTFGALAAAGKYGVLTICGTGQNTFLMNPDGTWCGCGGWGHILADEASAYGMAQKALKTCVDHDDQLVLSSYDLACVRRRMKDYFKANDWYEMLDHIYYLDKTFMSRFAVEIMKGAREEDDEFCKYLFYRTGELLGRSIVAVCNRAQDELFYNDKCVQVLLIGSVFKSFDLMKQGFIDGLKPKYPNDVRLTGIRLVELTVPSSIGAAYLAIEDIETKISVDYSKNTKVVLEIEL